MTTRTVTVHEEIEKEVQVCDECGLSDDHGKLWEVTDLPGDDMHFHKHCASDKTTLNEAHEQYISTPTQTIEVTALLFNTVTFSLLNIGILLFVASVTILTGPGAYMTMVLAAIFYFGALSIARDHAKETIEHYLKY